MTTPVDTVGATKDERLMRKLDDDSFHFCLTNSALMVHDAKIGTAVAIPHTLLPYPMYRGAFNEAMGISDLMNELYDRVAHDSTFLINTLSASAKVDDFMGSLLNIYKRVYLDRNPTTFDFTQLPSVEAKDEEAGELVKLVVKPGCINAPPQTLTLSITRSDYMMDTKRDTESKDNLDNASNKPGIIHIIPQQIEMNMIAAGFAASASLITSMHRDIVSRHVRGQYGYSPENIPANSALEGVARSMEAAVAEYHKRYASLLATEEVKKYVAEMYPGCGNGWEVPRRDRQGEATNRSLPTNSSSNVNEDYLSGVDDLPYLGLCVLMVVQPGERNAVDQRHIEYRLSRISRSTPVNSAHDQARLKEYGRDTGIQVLRRTVAELTRDMCVHPETGLLFISGRPIALVYYRAGYAPTDLTTPLHWATYETLEACIAIKCPSLGHHLSGAKKVQQELAMPGVLERFVTQTEAMKLRRHFAEMYGLEKDDDTTKAVISRAVNNPGKFCVFQLDYFGFLSCYCYR